MNFRQTIRENWDIGVWVTAIGLILGWALFVAFISPLLGQTSPRAMVSWNAIQDSRLVGYKVKRGASATAYDQSTMVGNVTSWQDSTIEPTTKYWYAVVGIDAQGQEGETGVNSANPFRFSDIQPATPTSLAATKQVQQGKVTVTLTWSQTTKTRSLALLPPEAIISYQVFMSGTQGGSSLSWPASSNVLQVINLKKNQTLYFYVTSIWNGIESLGSPAVRVQA